MHLCKVVAFGSMAAWYLSSVALAVSITNRDDHDQKVTIIEGAVTKDQILKQGSKAVSSKSPEDFANFIKAEIEKFRPVIKAAGLEGSQ